MEISPYILSKSLPDGNVYYNTKNNHSFFITNELLRKVEYDETTKMQYYDYDDALKHLNFNKGRNPRSAYYESIVQIGNQDNQPDKPTCKASLKSYVASFQEPNPKPSFVRSSLSCRRGYASHTFKFLSHICIF